MYAHGQKSQHGKKFIFQHQAQAMINRKMQLLNHVRLCLGCFDADVAHIFQFTIFCSRQSNDLQALILKFYLSSSAKKAAGIKIFLPRFFPGAII